VAVAGGRAGLRSRARPGMRWRQLASRLVRRRGPGACQKALAYAQCMRSPRRAGLARPRQPGEFRHCRPHAHRLQVPPVHLVKTLANRADFSAPASAYKACRHLLPYGGQITAAEQQKIAPLMLKFATCMRSHGITNMPDPIVNSQGVSVNPHGLDIHSPQFQAAQHACQKYMREAGKYIPPG
jgi:hypothetical protein